MTNEEKLTMLKEMMDLETDSLTPDRREKRNMFIKFKKIAIKGVASVLPKDKLLIKDLSPLYSEKVINRVRKLTGIESVHIASDKYTASDYCLMAAEKLFEEMNFEKTDIDAIVFITQTPDYIIPHTTAVMQDRLGLRKDILTFDINYGCAGYIYGLFQAYSLINTGACKNVLLCCGDTLSKYVNPKDKSLRLLIGDAGTATLVSSVEDDFETVFSFYSDGSNARDLIIPAGASRQCCCPGITDVEIVDDDGNVRTEENLYMNGIKVMNFVFKDVKIIIEQILKESNLDKNKIDLYLFHQANEIIVKYLAKTLKLDDKKVPLSLKNNGNTASCSIPLLLSNKYGSDDSTSSFDNVLLCGFGTGLSVGVCNTKLDNVHVYKTDFR